MQINGGIRNDGNEARLSGLAISSGPREYDLSVFAVRSFEFREERGQFNANGMITRIHTPGYFGCFTLIYSIQMESFFLYSVYSFVANMDTV